MLVFERVGWTSTGRRRIARSANYPRPLSPGAGAHYPGIREEQVLGHRPARAARARIIRVSARSRCWGIAPPWRSRNRTTGNVNPCRCTRRTGAWPTRRRYLAAPSRSVEVVELRRGDRRRMITHPEMAQDAPSYVPLLDERQESHPAVAHGTGQDIDLERSLHQPRP
jgi:hypothetical protein